MPLCSPRLAATPYYRNAATRDQFDAQTSGKLDAVIRAVSAGTPSLDAAREAFGDFEPLELSYMRHVQKPILPYSRLRTETKIAQSSFTSRALSEAEPANTRAALHAVMGRPVEARALIADARRRERRPPVTKWRPCSPIATTTTRK